MTAQTKTANKAKFESGDVPTQADFVDLIDSYQDVLAEGPFVDGDKTKLNGIETGATADQTGAEIKAAYEGEANTNAYTDAAASKLAGIATGATANASDATLLARANHTGTQAISTVTGLQSALDGKQASGSYATGGQGALADTAVQPGDDVTTLGSGAATNGYVATANGAGAITWAEAPGAGAGSGTVTSIAVSGSDGIQIDSGSPVTTSGTIALGVDATAMLTHLGVESGADVTDTANVTAAGALMDSEVTNLAAVKAFDPAAYATAAQGALANTAVQPAALSGYSTTGHTHVFANITDATENVQDIVGAMVSSNTETNITVTYQDSDGTLDFSVNLSAYALTSALPTRGTLNLDTDDSPQFAAINLGNASDTTLARAAAGRATIEGAEVVRSSTSQGGTGTDVVQNIVSCTQAEYDALTPNAATFYLITDAA